MKTLRSAIPAFLVCLIMVVSALHAQEAAVNLSARGDIVAGGPISLHIKFDKPLPEGASVRVEVSPQGTTQWVGLSIGDADNPSRTTFTVAGKLPKNAVPGTWVVRNVWLFLPGSVQGQALGHTDGTFQVKGKEFPIPSMADITVTK